jgi:hypothetical protein
MGIPRPNSGQIKASFGKLADAGEDLIVANGPDTARADRALVMHTLAPLWEELTRRGYDPKSIRFSVNK